jgi:hypothetical protein
VNPLGIGKVKFMANYQKRRKGRIATMVVVVIAAPSSSSSIAVPAPAVVLLYFLFLFDIVSAATLVYEVD